MLPHALRRTRPRTIALAVLALVAVAVPALASQSLFVSIPTPDIKGTGIQKGFEAQIEATGFSLGFSTPIDPASLTPSGATRMNPLVVTKLLDTATPLLAQAAFNKTPLQNFKITALVPPLHGGTTGSSETVVITVPSGIISEWRVVDAKGGAATEQITIATAGYSIEHRDTFGKPTNTTSVGAK